MANLPPLVAIFLALHVGVIQDEKYSRAVASRENKKNTSSEHIVYKYYLECQNKNNVLNLYFSCNSMNNL